MTTQHEYTLVTSGAAWEVEGHRYGRGGPLPLHHREGSIIVLRVPGWTELTTLSQPSRFHHPRYLVFRVEEELEKDRRYGCRLVTDFGLHPSV